MRDDIPAKPDDPFESSREGRNVLRFEARRTDSARTQDGIESFEDTEPGDDEAVEKDDIDGDAHVGHLPESRPKRYRDWFKPSMTTRIARLLAAAFVTAIVVFVITRESDEVPRSEVRHFQGAIPSVGDATDPYGLRPISVPAWQFLEPPPSPFLQWERDNAPHADNAPRRYRGLDPFEPAPPAPTPVPVGMTVDLKAVSPMPNSLLSWAIEYARLPRGTMDIRHAGSDFSLSLADYSLTPDGVLVASSSQAGELIVPLGVMVLLMWLAYIIHRRMEGDFYADNSGVAHVAIVVCCAVGFMLAGVLSPVALALLPIAFLPPAAFRRIALLLVSAWLAYLCVTTPIEPPNAALAHLYGPLGRSSWDIVWLGALSALFLLANLRLPRQIITIRVAAPLIQDVRVVER